MIKCAAFFLVSFFFLMQIFRYSTYHKLFKLTFPVLFTYSIFTGFLFFYFDLSHLFLFHIILISIFLYAVYEKQKKAAGKIVQFWGVMSPDSKTETELSVERTYRYFIMSSVVYVLVFAASFIYFFNRQFWQ